MKVDSVKTEFTCYSLSFLGDVANASTAVSKTPFNGDVANASTAVSKTPFNEARLRLERSKSLPLSTKTEQGTYIVIEAALDYIRGIWNYLGQSQTHPYIPSV